MRTSHQVRRVKVPFLWRACSWLCMILLGVFLFNLILRKSGVSFPIAAGQSTDPFFFAAVFGILIPILLQVFVDKILKGIVLKRSFMEITKEVGRDIAATSIETLIGGGSETDDR